VAAFFVSAIFEEAFMAAVSNATGEVLSRKQAACYLGICLTTLSRLNIPHAQIRKRVMYRKTTLDSWLAKQERMEKRV
jgi:hypothetical protein